MRLDQLSKHFSYSGWGIFKTCILNASTASSGVEKRWPLILFFTYGNKMKSFVAKLGLYGGWLIKSMFWVLKNPLFQPICENSHCSGEQWSVFCGWFFWFLGGRQLANKWLCITQNWLFCIVLVVRLQHVQFFRENKRSFAWKCFVPEQLLLDLAHLETPTQSTVVYFRAHTRKFTIHHLSRYHRRVSKHCDSIFGEFRSTTRHEPVFQRLTNCAKSNANKFFWHTNVHAILYVCWSH